MSLDTEKPLSTIGGVAEADRPVGGPAQPATSGGQRSNRRLSVLLLCDDTRGHANTVREHIAAFRKCSRHDVRTFNPRGLTHSSFLDLDEFDVLVIHYSLVIISDHYLAPAFREQIRRFRGLKVQLIQDEYRWVEEMTGMMRDLGIQVLWTLLPPAEIPKVYGARRLPGVRTIHTLGGYVPEVPQALIPPPIESRPIDIGYRGRTLPYWLGRLAQEKVWIAQGVLERAERYGLRCDIRWREEDRIYGRSWNRFLSSCKATLGTESGASITDFDGSVERRTLAYLAEHPEADFWAVSRAVLEPFEGNVKLQVVSPRVFEAAAMRTALILFPGEYSGVVQPWVHYIPLAKDFSNMEEVVRSLRDAPFLRSLTEQTYTDLVASGRYSHRRFVAQFDEVLDQERSDRVPASRLRYRLATVERPVALIGQRLLRAADPVLRIPRAVMKAGIAVAFLLQLRPGRALLARWLGSADLRRQVSVRRLLRDVLKLAVVRQAMRSSAGTDGRFRISLHLDPEHGRLLFVSHRLNGRSHLSASGELQGTAAALQPGLKSVIRERRLRTMAWEHSAVRGDAQLCLPWSVRVRVFVGEHDLHRFDCLLCLGQHQPDLLSEFLCAMLAGQIDPMSGRS